MPSYSQIRDAINNMDSVRSFLSRVVSGQNPDGSAFSIGSTSGLPSAVGAGAGSVLTLAEDDDSSSAAWSLLAQSGSSAIDGGSPSTTYLTAQIIDGGTP